MSSAITALRGYRHHNIRCSTCRPAGAARTSCSLVVRTGSPPTPLWPAPAIATAAVYGCRGAWASDAFPFARIPRSRSRSRISWNVDGLL